jgi:hypothetical protein
MYFKISRACLSSNCQRKLDRVRCLNEPLTLIAKLINYSPSLTNRTQLNQYEVQDCHRRRAKQNWICCNRITVYCCPPLWVCWRISCEIDTNASKQFSPLHCITEKHHASDEETARRAHRERVLPTLVSRLSSLPTRTCLFAWTEARTWLGRCRASCLFDCTPSEPGMHAA